MNNWTDADNRMRAHMTTTDRINRQAWRRDADRSDHRFSGEASARLKPRLPAILRGALALCRAAGRRLAVPIHRGVEPS